VEKLFGNDAVLISHINTGKRHTVETTSRSLLGVVRCDKGVENTELSDNRRIGIGEQVVGHAVLVGEGQELFLVVIADAVNADTSVIKKV